jgi:hypothetical protein
MRITTACSLALMLALGLPGGASSKDNYTLIDEVIIPSSGEPAAKHNPACARDDDKTTAQTVFGYLSKATDAYLGGPYTASVSEMFPEKDAWKAARLGIHDGKSRCRLLCAIVPNDADVVACMRDNTGKSCTSKNKTGDWGIGWMAVVGVQTASAGKDNVVFCATGKNWSHNRERAFSLEVK